MSDARNKLKLVSVALTTYNGEKFLQQQLDSIVNQTYSNIEIIIVDDCSTDRTQDLLNRFRQDYEGRIELYFNETNLGLVKNFEKVLGYCNGDFIALCDQDDVWESQKIERLVEHINSSSLIYSDASLIDDNGEVFVTSRTREYNLNNRSGLVFEDLLFKNYVVGCTALFKKSILIDVLPFPEHALFHDWWIAIIASKSCGIKYLDESLVSYRQHNANVYGQREGGLLKHVVSMFYRDLNKVEEFKQRLKRLEFMRECQIFTKFDRKMIDEAINYYCSYIQRGKLFYHWVLVVKFYSRITTKKNVF